MCNGDGKLKGVLALVLMALSLNSVASDCTGHVFFYRSIDAVSDNDDYEYFYSQIKEWLTEKGISHSYHAKLPLIATTCFGNLSIDQSQFSSTSQGYLFSKSGGESKAIHGTLTAIDLQGAVNAYFK